MNKKLLKTTAAVVLSAMLCGCAETPSTNSDSSSVISSDSETMSEQSAAESSDLLQSSAAETAESEVSSSAPDSDSTPESSESEAEPEVFEVNGKLIATIDHPTLGKHAWGIWFFSGWSGDTYASYINEFKEKVGDGVNVFNMVIPMSSEYYTPEGYEDYNASQKNTINDIANRLVNVVNVDACTELAEHTDEYIYFRTDHHWQALGAYYAAKKFAETALVDLKDISEYERHDLGDFVGALYALSDCPEALRKDPDQFTYYVSPTPYDITYYTGKFEIDKQVELIKTMFIEPGDMSDAYCVYMGGDSRIVKLTTGNENGRKLCLFKDSFGSALAPFLIDGFEEVYICDVRFFDCDAYKFIKDNGITDVLFNFCAFSTLGQICDAVRTNVLGYDS